jgi:hypothetical protein
VVLDPVYSGKAVHCLLREMQASPDAWRGRRCGACHTASHIPAS